MLISAPAISIGTGVLRCKCRMERNILGVKSNLSRKIGDSLVIQTLVRIGETACVIGAGVIGRE